MDNDPAKFPEPLSVFGSTIIKKLNLDGKGVKLPPPSFKIQQQVGLSQTLKGKPTPINRIIYINLSIYWDWPTLKILALSDSLSDFDIVFAPVLEEIKK